LVAQYIEFTQFGNIEGHTVSSTEYDGMGVCDCGSATEIVGGGEGGDGDGYVFACGAAWDDGEYVGVVVGVSDE